MCERDHRSTCKTVSSKAFDLRHVDCYDSGMRPTQARWILAVTSFVGAPLPISPGVAYSQTSVARFEAASIKPCKDMNEAGGRSGGDPARLVLTCRPLAVLIETAYLVYATGHFNPTATASVIGGPPWINSDLYRIEAVAEGAPGQELMKGPMLRALLADRFKLRIHRESKEIPVYDLTVAKGGPKLQLAKPGSCMDHDHPAPFTPTTEHPVPRICGGLFGFDVYGTTIANLCDQYSAIMDRKVIDKTGITGVFDVHLEINYADLYSAGIPGLVDASALQPPTSDVERAAKSSAIRDALLKLGLRLEPGKGPGETLVIDNVDRPSEN